MIGSDFPKKGSVIGGVDAHPAPEPSDPPDAMGSVEQLLDLHRLGVIMTPHPDRPEEAWGVLNPASARSRDGELYLFPRLVAEGNYSRIGIARAVFDNAGNPVGVERMGIALEPKEAFEQTGPGTGGVEDPRITYIPLLDAYVMSYTGLGPDGPRIALAWSKDLFEWDRLGLLHFEPVGALDLNLCDNKDCVIFPQPVTDPAGQPAFALLHRPTYYVPQADGSYVWLTVPGVEEHRPSIWISYVPVELVAAEFRRLTHVTNHQLLARPLGAWEHHHIGAGAPPILSEEGWLIYYHGVLRAMTSEGGIQPGGMVYQSGVMLLDRNDPRQIRYRSFKPVLRPQEPVEKHGIVPDVVFPTAVDVRGERIDVYYGAADERIAAATTRISNSVLLAPSAPFTWDTRRPTARRVHAVSRRQRAATSPAPRVDRRPYARILVALDGSDLAESVLDSVEPLAQIFASRVTLLRVISRGQSPLSAGVTVGGIATGDQHTQCPSAATARQKAEEYLAAMKQRPGLDGLSVDSECLEGSPSELILERARDLRVDLVALTTHGRTGVDRLLLGSVAEEIVRRAPCPVHLVRAQGFHRSEKGMEHVPEAV